MSEHVSFSKKDITLIRYQNSSKENIIQNNNLVNKKYSHTVEALGKELNFCFKEDLSIAFWKKSLSLGYKRYISMLHMAYCEFSSIDYSKFRVHAVLDKSCYFIPKDFEEQREFIQNTDLGREQLFSIYIEIFHPNIYRDAKKIKIKFNTNYKSSQLSRIKHNIKRLTPVILNKNKSIELGILDSFFSKENYSKLIANKKISSLLFKNTKNTKNTFIFSYRKNLGHSLNRNDSFDIYFIKSLESLFPSFFIEDFQYNKNFFKKELKKYPNLKYIVCEAWVSSTRDSFILAIAKEFNNIKHIYSEHNSLFHPFLGNNTEITSELVDTYYTLGWDISTTNLNKKISNIKKGASLFFDEPNPNRSAKKGQILFLDVAVFGYLEEYNTYYSESDFYAKYYFQFLTNFFIELNSNFKSNITYRGYPVRDRNWKTYDNKSILKKYFPPNIIFDDMQLSGNEMMKRSELNIIPYTNTGYLQSIILDVPTIFFWNKEIAHLDPNFLDFFDELIEVGICHTSPKSAANFLCSIENNINEWWLDKKTRSARKNFLDKNIGEPSQALSYYMSLAVK